MKKTIKTYFVFLRDDNPQAKIWSKKITGHLARRYPDLKESSAKPDLLIVLGGDGTILQAARTFHIQSPIILGLNMGHVGFLASEREPKKFLKAIDRFLIGNYRIDRRLMIRSVVVRNGKKVFEAYSMNDVTAMSLLGMVHLKVNIEGYPFQDIRGTGVLVSTATGSTAFNLSAHGPIVMPEIKCMILTELLDHNIPTPSVVVKRNKKIDIRVVDFRKHGILKISKTGEPAEVLLIADTEIFPLEKGDMISIVRSNKLIRLAELEKNYFLKSLQDKFLFR